MTVVLFCEHVSKSYPGVRSLDDVGITIRAGTIHALVGENGAGKSTLVRILSGSVEPDAGAIEFKGKKMPLKPSRTAKRAGIHVVHQELMLFPDLTVTENVFVGQELHTRFGLLDHGEMRRRAKRILEELGTDIDVDADVSGLSIADQQMVEIARAFVGSVDVLILDEPTAVISGREVELLFDRLRKLRAQGVAIVYISHRLEEIFELADELTVLKDGKFVASRSIEGMSRAELVRLMVGRELGELYPAKRGAAPAKPVLQVRQLGDGARVRSVCLTVNAGEILGLAGMVGSGRTEFAELVYGARQPTTGSIEFEGAAYSPSIGKSIAAGVALLTEDRKSQGLMLNLSVAANITAPRLREVSSGGVIALARENRLAGNEIAALSIAGAKPATAVINLSGGNQQKVLFARWRAISKKLLILDEPTRGIDVGAKAEIYRIIRACADAGIAVLVISSEMQEVIGLSDRVAVMREGVIAGELEAGDITEEAIVHLATHGGERAA